MKANPDTVGDALRAARVIPVLRLASREAAAFAIDCVTEAGYRTVVDYFKAGVTVVGIGNNVIDQRARLE